MVPNSVHSGRVNFGNGCDLKRDDVSFFLTRTLVVLDL